MTARSFSIVIPTYNRAAVLAVTLDSVAALAMPYGWRGEVLVIDNRSPDDTAAVVEERAGRFPLPLRRIVEDRQGAGHARNRGIAESRADWLIFLDDDIKIATGWLKAFADVVQRLTPDAVVGPVFPWFEAEVPPWCTGRVLDSVTSAYSRKGDRTLILMPGQSHELPGCNFAIRRDFACRAAGFNPALDRIENGMLSGGDFELGRTITAQGAQVAYVPGCRIEHFISVRKMSKDSLRQRWYGLGQSVGAARCLRGGDLPLRHKARLVLRLARLQLRVVRDARRCADAAFRWELEARWLQGFLFGRLASVEGNGTDRLGPAG